MSTTYEFYVGTPVDIASRVSQLDSRLSIDLEISATYTSTVYNGITENVEITFSAALSDFQICILNNLAGISLYDKVTGINMYNVNANDFNRRSFSVSGNPGVNHDELSGYTIGSTISNTLNEIYICSDNSTSAAVWGKVYPQLGATGPTGPEGAQGETGPTGIMMGMAIGEVYYEGATATVTTTIPLTVNIAQEINPVTTLNVTTNFDMPANGRLRYTGTPTIKFHCAFSISARLNSGANQLMFFQLRKNSNIIAGGNFQVVFQNSNDFQGLAFHKVVDLSTNDYLSMFVTNLSGSNDLEVYNLNIVAVGDGS
jgi:hypothetical protein